jgi:hypothetical protein
VFLWYNILQKKNLLIKEEPEKAAETEKSEAEPNAEGAASSEKKTKRKTPGSEI